MMMTMMMTLKANNFQEKPKHQQVKKTCSTCVGVKTRVSICLLSVARNEQEDRRLRRLQQRETQRDDDDDRER